MRTLRPTPARRAVALALAAGNASAQFTNIYLLRRQPDRRRLVQARAAARHRTVHDESRARSGRRSSAQRYGFTATPANQGGTDYAQGGARVTSLPGVPASPPTGTRGADRDADLAVPRARVRSIRTRSTRSGAAPTTSSSSWACCRPAWRRRRRCRPASALAAVAAGAGRSRRSAPAARSTSSSSNLPDIGKTPFGVGVRARRARSPRSRRSSTPR